MPSTRGDVTITVGSEIADAARKWDELRRKGPEAFEDALKDLAQQSRRAGKETQSQFAMVSREIGRAALALTGFGGVIGTLTTLVQVVRSEIQNIERLRQQRAESQVEFGRELSLAFRAVGPQEGLTAQQIGEIALDISRKSGVSPVAALNLITEASSARGEIQLQQALEVARTVAELAPSRPRAELAALTFAGVRSIPFSESPAAAAAATLQGFRAFPTVDPKTLERVPPAIFSIQQALPGTQAETANALLVAIAQLSGEKRLEQTTTAGVKFAQSLLAGIRDAGIKQPLSLEEILTGPRALLKEGTGIGEEIRRSLIGFLDQADVEATLKDPKLSVEARTAAAVQGFLTTMDRTTASFKSFDAAIRQNIKFGEAGLQQQRDMAEQLRRTPLRQAMQARLGGIQTTDVSQIEDPSGATQKAAQEAFKVIRESGGTSLFTQRIDPFLFTQQKTTEDQLGFVRQRLVEAAGKEAGVISITRPRAGRTASQILDEVDQLRGQLDPESQKDIKDIEKQLDVLKDIRSSLQRENVVTIEGQDGERVPGRSGAQEAVTP